MSTASVAIMAHPDRLEQAHSLYSVVGAHAISVDHDGIGEVANGDRAWGLLSSSYTDWGIVLQDDALATFDFLEQAEAALDFAPFGPVSFYVGTGRPYPGVVRHAVRRAIAEDADWLEDPMMHWGVAIAMPTEMILEFLDWGTHVGDLPYDRRIGTFWRQRGIPTRYSWPSLVDHADGETLVHHRKPSVERRAHLVGSRAQWGGRVVRIGAVAPGPRPAL